MMRRREFITLLGGATVWPVAAWAQQSAMPTIGYLSPRSPDVEAQLVAAFRRGLGKIGYVEGVNVAIEYRWADGRFDRLPILANMLVARSTVMVTTGGPQSARAVLAATSTTPVVFWSGSDPIEDGLVTRFERPEGNATGFHVFSTSLGPKRLELLRELTPKTHVAFLVNPSSPTAKMQVTQVQQAARAFGQAIFILNANTENEIDLAFASLVQRGAGALLMSASTFFQVRRDQIIALAARHAVPAMYEWPEFVRAGGLISYSTVRAEYAFQAGLYAGRLLKGAKIADLPVVQSSRFELVINLKTAKALGLTVPTTLLVAADEVIE